jgi:hypothetical protein
MKMGSRIRALAVAALLSVVPCQAQGLEGWHLRGAAGVDWFQTDFIPINDGRPEPSAPSENIGGDLGLDLSGIVLDPKFITFQSNFNFLHAANSTNYTDYSNGTLGGGVNFNFLPSGHYPLEVFYQRIGADTTGSLTGSNTDITQFRAQWTVDRNHFPHLVFSHEQDSNAFRVVTSLLNTGYKDSEWSIQANDRTAGWMWNAGLNLGNFNATTVGTLTLASGTRENSQTLDGSARRDFWGGKALFDAEVQDQHYVFNLPGTSASRSDLFLSSANLRIQHSQKLSSHYTYSLTYENVENTATAAPLGISLLNLPALDIENVDAGVSYQLARPLRVFQDVDYQHLSPISSTTESQTSFLQSSSGVSGHTRWRGFDLDATYTGLFQKLGTNFDHRGQTFSNNIDARAAWGSLNKAHLTGKYLYDKLDFVEQIGGFARYNTASLQAETAKFRGVRLLGGVDHGQVELLNLSGDTRRHYTNYSAQVEAHKLDFIASRGLDLGAGSIFPAGLIGQFFLTTPLPVGELIFTPLLNRTSRTTSFSLLAHPKRNLDIMASFRKEADLLQVSDQNFRLWEVSSRYRIGKVSLDAGVGSLRTAITESSARSGLTVNRYWVRIRRTFNIF